MRVLTYGGEADGDGGGLAHVLKHLGLAVATDVMGHLEVAKRSCWGRGTVTDNTSEGE